MNSFARALALATAIAGLSAPAWAAQFEANAQAEGVIGDIIDGLIGKRYGVNERQAIRTCGWAAVRQAENQWRPYYKGPPKAYANYRGYVRVTAITDVTRRANGHVRVRGLLDTARYGYGKGSRGADLVFRCDVDRRGRVSNLNVDPNPHRWRG